MKKSGPTLAFYVHFRDGKEDCYEFASFDEMKSSLFKNEEELKEKVQWISWKDRSTLITYTPETEEFHRSIADGDVNPYGWRLQHK
jgi:hypothetical protein